MLKKTVIRLSYRFSSTVCPITGKISSVGDKVGVQAPKPFESIPGPFRFPVLGSLPDLILRRKDMNETFTDYYNEYGPIVRVKIVGEEVLLFDPNDSLHVFRADGKYPKGASSDF